jgi:hypothetical protein
MANEAVGRQFSPLGLTADPTLRALPPTGGIDRIVDTTGALARPDMFRASR